MLGSGASFNKTLFIVIKICKEQNFC